MRAEEFKRQFAICITGVFMKYERIAIMAFILIGLLAFGCLGIGEQPKAVEPTDTGQPTPSATVKQPSFEVLGPVEGASIKTAGETANVQVVLDASNLVFRSPGGKNKAGEGHFHISLDGGSEVMTIDEEYTFENVALGEHTLRVEIKQNDHNSYVPKIVKTINFKVEKEVIEAATQEYTVSIKNSAFAPQTITVNVGDSIVWKNDDQMPHTVISTGNFNTGTITSGSSKKVILDKEGTFDYFCTLNPNMKGKVIVIKE